MPVEIIGAQCDIAESIRGTLRNVEIGPPAWMSLAVIVIDQQPHRAENRILHGRYHNLGKCIL